VRVRVQASSLNPLDVTVANGDLKGRLEHRFPVILGWDFAGVVDALGRGTKSFSVGDNVMGVAVKPYVGDGTFAEFVTVSASLGIVRRPKNLSITDAGLLGVAGAAALEAVDVLDLSPNQTVLISGAAGGVGNFAAQLAARSGARVIAIAKPRDAEFVRSTGASAVVDPAAVEEVVPTLAPGGVDAAVHLAGDVRMLGRFVKAAGRLVTTLRGGLEPLLDLPLRTTAIVGTPSNAVLARLANLVAEGHLRTRVHWTYALEQLPEGMTEFLRGGKRGKVSVFISR
jgi:NADPH:quinone reductase-like Zn-dependent oxidoreductase